MKGIIKQNSFEQFNNPEFVSLASSIGVEIDVNLARNVIVLNDSGTPIEPEGNSKDPLFDVDVVDPVTHLLDDTTASYCSNLEQSEGLVPTSHLDSPVTPEGLKEVPAVLTDHSVIWSKISKHRWGKHPKKMVIY